MSARTVCLNDTDGDGDCAACARNPEALCRVTPRERLIRSVYQKLSQNQMERLVDAFASALAQAIRSENPDRSDDWSDGVEWAADLIDPMKEGDRG